MGGYNEIKSLESGCINCLQYFGLFKYPLKKDEIHRFNPVKCTPGEVENCLTEMHGRQSVFCYDEFYLTEDKTEWIKDRLEGNLRAALLLKKSPKYVRIISSFPFVKSIAISGSLSKNYASAEPDIDYFIITESNRLWIARTLLHLFKKLTFITGHQHFFCMNYFIDTNALELKQRNQYAAIELATLMPVYNESLVRLLIEKNNWIRQFLPNFSGNLNTDYLITGRNRQMKRFWEILFNLLFPEKLNRILMKITDKKWRKKWRHHNFTHEEYEQALQTEIHISKNHPDNYEKQVLDSLSENHPKPIIK